MPVRRLEAHSQHSADATACLVAQGRDPSPEDPEVYLNLVLEYLVRQQSDSQWSMVAADRRDCVHSQRQSIATTARMQSAGKHTPTCGSRCACASLRLGPDTA